jgi:hypothetical protein
MSPFDLRTSPFYLLGVSPRDDRAVIEGAVEVAIADGKLSEAEALRAQQALMAPKPRLSAEVAWLAGVPPNRARKLIDAVALDPENASGLPLLAGANIAGHRCAQKLAPSYPDLLLTFYDRKDDEEILGLLNPERRASAFPEVPRELMPDVLQELMRAHTAALLVFITDQPNPGRALHEILHKHFVNGSNVISFLDDLVDRFDEWAADALRAYESAMSEALDCIKKDPPSLKEHLHCFTAVIDQWSSLAAPRQFIMARRHLKDARTDKLLPKIRGVCLHLHNDLGDPKTSLAITKAALPAFEGSPEHQQLIQADIQTLEELAASHLAFKTVEPLIALVTEVNDKHRELCTSIKRGNFRQDGSGIARNLYRLFLKAEQDLAGDPARAAPFRIILSLAIDLNNQSQATEEALTLIRALQAMRTIPEDVAEKLNENGRIANQTILQKQLTAAAQGQRHGRCAALAKELEESSREEEDRAGWRKLRHQFEHRRNVQRGKWIGWAAVIGGIIFFASLSDNKSTSSSYPPVSTPAPSDVRPGDVFTASEIQWCVFELDRLKRIRTITGDSAPGAVANAWNARHADSKSRCSTKKYYQQDYDAAERLLQASSAQQQAEALSLYRSWSNAAPRPVPRTNR